MLNSLYNFLGYKTDHKAEMTNLIVETYGSVYGTLLAPYFHEALEERVDARIMAFERMNEGSLHPDKINKIKDDAMNQMYLNFKDSKPFLAEHQHVLVDLANGNNPKETVKTYLHENFKKEFQIKL